MSRKVMTRGAFSEQEVQRYAHADVSLLFAPVAAASEMDGAGNDPRSASADEMNASEAGALNQDPPPLSVEEMLAAVQQQAETILTFAQQEAERLRQEAHEQGLASGREEGREQAREEMLPALIAFAQLGQSLIVLEEQLIERFTPHLVRFALDIAEKIVGKAVEGDPRIIASVLERARAELPQARSIHIWLHPLDHQALMDCRPDLVVIGEKGGRTVEVFPSEEVERGGCRIETEMGVVDATIPVQLEEIRRQMLE